MNRKRLWRTKRKNKIKQNKKELLLGQIELYCCALSLVLGLFVGISPISDKAKIRFMYVGAALSFMAVPNAAKPTSCLMPVPLSSRLARSVRISPSSSALYSKLTSLVVKDSCIRRYQGRKDSLRSEQYRLLFKISNCSSTLFESLLSIVFQINLS